MDHHCEHSHPSHHHELLSKEQIQRVSRQCAALGDPSRLRLIELLLTGRHCVSELVAELDESLSATSQRLKQLYEAGLVTRAREGKHIYYEIIDERVRALMQTLLGAPPTPPQDRSHP